LRREALVSLLIGAAAGLLAGLTGVGGGVFLVPLMVGLLYLPQHYAHGTSFVVIFPMALVGVITYAHFEYINWVLMLWLSLGGVFGVLLGARLMTMLPEKSLRWMFGIFLLVTGLVMVITSSGIGGGNGAAQGVNGGIAVGVGFLAGILAGVMGVGGGVIMVPAMVLIMGVEQHEAQGVSLAVITLIAFIGMLAHYRLENVRLKAALWIIPAAVVFGFVGSLLAHLAGEVVLRQLVGSLIIIMGTIIVVKDLRTRWVPT
jgi:uncharacterized membrane protein YfcA